MPENRQNNRFTGQAHAHIASVLESKSVLKNLSITGCCVEGSACVEMVPGTTYQMEIIPEQNSKIEKFTLEVEFKWLRVTGDYSEIGFNVIASPKGKHFQRYVDYLTYRSSLA